VRLLQTFDRKRHPEKVSDTNGVRHLVRVERPPEFPVQNYEKAH